VDEILPVHPAQLLTYLKAANKQVGLLINFQVPILKQGIKRIANSFIETAEVLDTSAPSASTAGEPDAPDSPLNPLRFSPRLCGGRTSPLMLQRFLDPATLASISSLDLVAKTVVDGFVAGMHRSPDFGFSQEFAEYRAYSEGDDLRHVDWNVFARTDKCFLKRYRGETNSQLLLLLDTSASMGYSSQQVNKLEYAKFVSATLCYMANLQRDAAGLIIFDEDVKNYVAPSTRQGQLFRLLHAIEKAEVGTHTDFSKPFVHFQNFLHRRGLVVVMSDFYADPELIVKTVEPLRYKGNEVILFHMLDPQEIKPKFREPVLLYDLEDTTNSLEVSPDYARQEYRKKIDSHIETLASKARGAGMDYFLMDTGRPLDEGLREYLQVRKGRF
jgi:uncharacterized protein (DUF58 family)